MMNELTYQDNHASIYQGDCRRLLQQLDFTVAITSPPYNMHLRVNNKRDGYTSRGTAPSSANVSSKYVDYEKQLDSRPGGPNTSALQGYTDDLPMDDYFDMCRDVIDLLLEKSRLVFWNVQMVTGNKPALMRLMGHYSSNIKEIIIWDKISTPPAMQQIVDGEHKVTIMKSRYEFVFVLAKQETAITRSFQPFNMSGEEAASGIDNIWGIYSHGEKKKVSKGHNIGAVMPIELPMRIMKYFCTPDDIIVDPFMGSGTTLRAAKDLNMKSIGIELSSDLCNFAAKRLAQEVLPL